MFKYLPMKFSDNSIIEFLNAQQGVYMKYGVIISRLRNKEKKSYMFFSHFFLPRVNSYVGGLYLYVSITQFFINN